MSKQIGYKFRIYPSMEQQEIFARHFGCVRFIHNYLLKYRTESYVQDKKSVSVFEIIPLIAELKRKEGYGWLKVVNSQSLQAAALDLENGFSRFFKKLGGYPKFKKKANRQSFKVPQNFSLDQSGAGNWFLYLPKIKSGIRTEVHRKVEGTVKQVTISQDPDGCYYASLNCEVTENFFVAKKDNGGKKIGIDLGLTSFITTSDGEKIETPKYLRKSEDKLKVAQKRLSKKVKGSINRKKARKKVAKLHKKVSNQRKDFLHKVSSRLIDENQVIYREDLNIEGMVKARNLSKSIADAAWGEFIRYLTYKAVWYGKLVIQIGRFEPSSKLCSCCGYKNNELTLSERSWKCKLCLTLHDRDVNAALNILKLGQGMPDVKPVERSTSVFSIKRMKVGSTKQEADLDQEYSS